jgi:thiamine-monophosphate kinase
MARDDEFDLIRWIQKQSPVRPPVELGIGDDCAILGASAIGRSMLVTTDMLVEGRHFLLEAAGPELVGRKALAVNLSDIAAMAGRPTAAFISVALPRSRGRELAEGLYRGLLPLAERFGVTIAGGDTNSWDGPLVINVTLMGESGVGGPVRRSGAGPGDILFVTGPLGGSLGGRHLTFEPRVDLALQLKARFKVLAMMDVSDGLSSDLRHMAEACGAGAVIEADRIPIHDDVDSGLTLAERVDHALSDGEDFELLFAVSPAEAAQLERPDSGFSVHRIGRLATGEGVSLERGGEIFPLPVGGWVHRLE